MLPDKESFYNNFPKFTDGMLQCVDGVVTNQIVPGSKILCYSSCVAFIDLFNSLDVGMTIDQCWELWCKLAAEHITVKWGQWLHWTPGTGTWWIHPITSERLCFRNGHVAYLTDASQRTNYIRTGRRCNPGFKAVNVGMSLEEVRKLLLNNACGHKTCEQVYYFKPRIRRTPKVTHTQEERDRKSVGLPPYLSTGRYDVRMFRKGDSEVGKLDLVQVCLFALTKVWSDNARTEVNPVVKNHVNDYFAYAKQCLQEYADTKRNHTILPNIKPGKMRVTKDCCIEVDFDVK